MSELRDIVNAATHDGWWQPLTDLCDCQLEWPCGHGEYCYALSLEDSDELVYDHAEWHGSVADATFIATFDPTLVSALLDVLDEARAACPELNGERHGTLHAALDRLAALEGNRD